jgi:hypothetical protein
MPDVDTVFSPYNQASLRLAGTAKPKQIARRSGSATQTAKRESHGR